MAKSVGTPINLIPSAGQVQAELETVEAMILSLKSLLRDLGNTGVSDPLTGRELENHLEASLAACYRWREETRLSGEARNINGGMR